MNNFNNNLNLSDEERKIFLDSLIYYLYEFCEFDLNLFNKVNDIIDKYFTEDDYLL